MVALVTLSLACFFSSRLACRVHQILYSISTGAFSPSLLHLLPFFHYPGKGATTTSRTKPTLAAYPSLLLTTQYSCPSFSEGKHHDFARSRV